MMNITTLLWRKYPVWFYNLREGRALDQVTREIRAILTQNPAVLGLCEAVGYRLPELPGYHLIRDTSTPGRANVAAYVHATLPVTRIRWTDCDVTWKRPKHPGVHPARSILTFHAGGVQQTVHHQPPRYVDHEITGQVEGNQRLTTLMAPWTRDTWGRKTPQQRTAARERPRVVIMDANRTGHDGGPGPAVLARAVQGRLVPDHVIDVGVVRGQIKIKGWTRPSRVAGVQLKSDHPHALALDLRVPRKWLTTAKEI